MAATPKPVTVPAPSSDQVVTLPKPTNSSPQVTNTTDRSMLLRVISTLNWIVCPGMENPSIAMKCITQMPVMPSETAAAASRPSRVRPVLTLARVVQRRARNDPIKDIIKASAGVTSPTEKLWTVSIRLISGNHAATRSRDQAMGQPTPGKGLVTQYPATTLSHPQIGANRLTSRLTHQRPRFDPCLLHRSVTGALDQVTGGGQPVSDYLGQSVIDAMRRRAVVARYPGGQAAIGD